MSNFTLVSSQRMQADMPSPSIPQLKEESQLVATNSATNIFTYFSFSLTTVAISVSFQCFHLHLSSEAHFSLLYQRLLFHYSYLSLSYIFSSTSSPCSFSFVYMAESHPFPKAFTSIHSSF